MRWGKEHLVEGKELADSKEKYENTFEYILLNADIRCYFPLRVSSDCREPDHQNVHTASAHILMVLVSSSRSPIPFRHYQHDCDLSLEIITQNESGEMPFIHYFRTAVDAWYKEKPINFGEIYETLLKTS